MSEGSMQIGRYIVLEELGSGGFSTVYRVEDTVLGREVALKVMRPLLLSDPTFVERFKREAQVMASLDHAHIIPIYDYGEFEDRLCLVMKLMPGGSVGHLVEDGPLPWERVLTITQQVAAALDYAHERRLVHRDVKPHNVLLDDRGRAVLADFGLVRALETGTITSSLSGGILGTPAYVPPEIWNGETATPASDIYSLACVVFNMATGATLFDAPTPPATMSLHFRPPQFPEEWPDGVPPGLEGVLARALARQPADRYRGAGALVEALAALADDPLAEPYAALQAALADERWPDAIALAERIMEQEPGYRDTRALLNRALVGNAASERATWAAQWREATQAALAAREWEEALSAARKWQEFAPEEEAPAAAIARAQEALAPPPVVPDDMPARPAPGPEKSPPATVSREPAAEPAQATTPTAATEATPTTGPLDRFPRWAWVAVPLLLVALVAVGVILSNQAPVEEIAPTEVVADMEGEVPQEAEESPPAAAEAEMEDEIPEEEPVDGDASDMTEPEEEEPAGSPAERTGAWVDTVTFVQVADPGEALAGLETADLDLYAAMDSPQFAERIEVIDELWGVRTFGTYYDLTFNPAECRDGRLNPFANPRIREAMNWLVDRKYIAQELLGGLGVPRYVPVNPADADHARFAAEIERLEQEYANDFERAAEVITGEMEALGAEMSMEVWTYEGAHVVLNVLILAEDERLAIGDYAAERLEAVGFDVVRDYQEFGPASDIWLQGDPAECLFHVYTGGWFDPAISRDSGHRFQLYYTPAGLNYPLWNAYTPREDLEAAASALAARQFTSLEERDRLFTTALDLALEDSARIWLADSQEVTPLRRDIQVAADHIQGIGGTPLWAPTLRASGAVGADLFWALPELMVEPWNPIAGSDGPGDRAIQLGTGQTGVVLDPATGLAWPNRIGDAAVTVPEDLPVAANAGWVEVERVPEITVPEDAWVDWDAQAQVWLTAGDVSSQLPTALVRSTVVYPEGAPAPAPFEGLTWHDGSPFSAADIMMAMIMTFERANPDSAIYDAYDETNLTDFEDFRATFKGWRIVQEQPLVVEYYSDDWQIDVENMVTTLWPQYGTGEAPWHVVGLANRLEAAGRAAYSVEKAAELAVEQVNLIGGPTVALLVEELQEAAVEGYLPYAPTMSQFVDEADVETRYENLANWYHTYGHFWVNTGPFFLREVSLEADNPAAILERYPAFPDPAGKWEGFAIPPDS